MPEPYAPEPAADTPAAVQAGTRLRLRVSPAAESAIRAGHPWLFADSIRQQNREGRLGELAVIYDRTDRFLAIGLFDPNSPLRVRVLRTGKPVILDEPWWRQCLRTALERRRGLFDERTNGYRWISGESDGWPGLVLDRYADVLVLKLYTAAWLPRLTEVVAMIHSKLQPGRVVLRLSRNSQTVARAGFQLEQGQVLRGDRLEACPTFLETGLRFEADVLRGQKTGFFLDQRENRRRVETLASGRDVLNAFSFTGGFSLYAARGGAQSVTDLDISPHALDAAQRNFALNSAEPAVARCRHATVQADCFEWLECSAAHQFDLVILDPPSLAKRESERAGAVQAYAKLATHGLRALRPGGILVAASCSAHVSAEEFFGAVRQAALRGRHEFEEMETTGHPPDHPATFAEAHYLREALRELYDLHSHR